jgi:hypothetical protein
MDPCTMLTCQGLRGKKIVSWTRSWPVLVAVVLPLSPKSRHHTIPSHSHNPVTWLTHLPHNWRHLIDPRPECCYPIACCRFEYCDRHFVEQRSSYLSVINSQNQSIRVGCGVQPRDAATLKSNLLRFCSMQASITRTRLLPWDDSPTSLDWKRS